MVVSCLERNHDILSPPYSAFLQKGRWLKRWQRGRCISGSWSGLRKPELSFGLQPCCAFGPGISSIYILNWIISGVANMLIKMLAKSFSSASCLCLLFPIFYLSVKCRHSYVAFLQCKSIMKQNKLQ